VWLAAGVVVLSDGAWEVGGCVSKELATEGRS
jgi:hypothetical protein